MRTALAEGGLTEFKGLSEEKVAKIIMNMKTEQCKLDTIPTHITKEALPQIQLALTKMVNMSLQSDKFAKMWKTTLVKPLIKKLNLDRIKGSYRPVSNIKYVSKIVKHSMLNQFSDHCKQYNLIPDYQSAYRENYSCETTIAKLVNDILWRMERQKMMAVMVIDLSAAFDMVDHQVLIEVLRNKFGIHGVALEWYKDYLYPRGCQVKVRDAILKVMDLPFSVLQRSCSGANLYSAYALTLQELILKGSDLHSPADDHGYKNSFPAKSRNKETTRITELEECDRNIKTWIDENRLKMNNSKTEIIMFGSRQHLWICTTNAIDINGEEILKSDCIKYLGSWVDALLSFKTHITKKCQAVMGNLVKICNIRKYLTEEATKMLLVGLVLSHLDYVKAILAGLPECDIDKIQRIENTAAKLAVKVRKHNSTTTALKSFIGYQ